MSIGARLLIAVAALLLFASRVRGEDLEKLIGVIDQLEATITSVDYHQKPLEEVLEELDDGTDIPIRADWELLRSIGVQPRQPISLRMQHAPISTVLAALLLQLGDRFEHPVAEAWAGHLILTTYRGTENMRLTSIYDVRDLLRTGDATDRLRTALDEGDGEGAGDQPERPEDSPASERPPHNNAHQSPADANAPGPDAAAANAAQEPPVNLPPDDPPAAELILPAAYRTPGEELMMLIVDHVDPEAWMSYGGTRASISAREGVLVVSAPASIHRQCRAVLRMLRRSDPSALMVEVSIVDLPRSTVVHLARRFDFAESAAAQAVLQSPEARLQWTGRVTGAMGESMSLLSEEKVRRFQVKVTPNFDRSTGRVAMDLSAFAEEGEDHRELETTLTIPLRGGAAVLEMPSATAVDTARLLVVVPHRQ